MEKVFSTHRSAHFTFILLVVICIFFLTAHLSRYVRGIKDLLFYVINPTPNTATVAIQSLEQFSLNLSEVIRIHQENHELRTALQTYIFLDNELTKAKEENERLRSLVNFSPPPQTKSIVARVTMREPGSWFQWVMIDRGKEDGVRLDAPVLAWAEGKPAIMGRVVEIYSHSAKIVLITNVLSAVPITMEASGEDGLLEGQNDARLKANYLMADRKAIAVGERVVTSPLSAVFPAGIMAGYVQEVASPAGETFRSATIKPAIDLGRLREVMVLVRKEK